MPIFPLLFVFARSLFSIVGLTIHKLLLFGEQGIILHFVLINLSVGRRDVEFRTFLSNHLTSLLRRAILDGFHSSTGTTEAYLARPKTRNHESKIPTRARRLLSTEPRLSVRARRLLSISILRGSIG